MINSRYYLPVGTPLASCAASLAYPASSSAVLGASKAVSWGSEGVIAAVDARAAAICPCQDEQSSCTLGKLSVSQRVN